MVTKKREHNNVHSRSRVDRVARAWINELETVSAKRITTAKEKEKKKCTRKERIKMDTRCRGASMSQSAHVTLQFGAAKGTQVALYPREKGEYVIKSERLFYTPRTFNYSIDFFHDCFDLENKCHELGSNIKRDV